MTEPITILAIDDNEDDRILYKRTLKKISDANYAMAEAEDGDEGIQQIQNAIPACILLDYSLPGRNGIEVLKHIRTVAPFVPVVMLTGQGNENVAVTAMQEGAQNYISKSTITPESLDHVIKVAIDHCTLEKRIDDQRTSLEVFTRALAHDLREPIRTIRSFIEIIQQGDRNSPEASKYFQHIQNAADRMHMLIDTVFHYTQLDAPETINRENCDTIKVLQDVKENLSQLIQERNASIVYDPLPNVRANRIQLSQVLQNILSNAIYHCPNPVTIHIRVEEQDDFHLFSISDNGPGINETHLNKIFDPFKRLVHHEEGAGLGLATCRKIIETHGGKIWCESTPGEGATFFFTLPKVMPENIANDNTSYITPMDATSQANLPLANILLVDDRKADLDLTRIRLIERPRLKCQLFMASSAEEALEILHDKNTYIDLMLIDINMPDMNGFELLEQMRMEDLLKKVTVIMCTGSTYEKDKEKSELLGAAGYLVKPGQFELLQSMLENVANVELCQKDGNYSLLSKGRI